MIDRFKRAVASIRELDREAMDAAQKRLDQLTKPPGSLGRLETIALQLAGIYRKPFPIVPRRRVVIMAGDHGVAAEGVSAYPAEVTPQMVRNFVHGGAAINVLARQTGTEVTCVDVGVAVAVDHPDVLQRNVRRGTRNMAEEPAMTEEEALQAIGVGLEVVEKLVDEGVDLFATGEMGIGNTTPSTALVAVFSGEDVNRLTGKGTGIDESRRAHKAHVIAKALALHRPSPEDPLHALATVGGLEIAGLVGLIIGAAAAGKAVVLDGLISTAAALVAVQLAPRARDYILPSHLSEEPAHRVALSCLGLDPALRLSMRLGEGTGAVLMLPVIDGACRVLREMATFEEAGVAGQEGKVPGV